MTNEPVFDDEIEVISSDGPPAFTMVPEWITYSALKPAQRDFWTVLASCVNHGRADNKVWPAGPELADAMRIRNPDQLKPYREALESIGAVVIKEKRYANGMRRRYVYDVRYHPPKGYTGPRTRQEWLIRRAERLAAEAAAESVDTAAFEAAHPDETAGQPGTPKNRGAGALKNGGTGASENEGAGTPENGGAKPDQQQPDQQQPERALAARSAGERRRPSAGSSAHEQTSGSAAADGASAPNRKSAGSGPAVLVTAEVQHVLAAFPPELRDAIQSKARTDRPKSLIKAIEQQLAGGGRVQAAKLAERVRRRWTTHRYAEHFAAGQLTSPIGTALAMVKDGPCPDPRCEDGQLEDGSPCRACIEREKNFRGDRERQRQLDRELKEREARLRACPHCQVDHGTNGRPCRDCAEVIDSADEVVARLIEQAVADHLLLAKPGEHEAEAADQHRRYLQEQIAEARRVASQEGNDLLGQAIAVRLCANDWAVRARRAREGEAEPGRQGALPAPADRSPSDGKVGIPVQASATDDRCPGPNAKGCPSGRPAIASDGLCTRCRIVVERQQPVATG